MTLPYVNSSPLTKLASDYKTHLSSFTFLLHLFFESNPLLKEHSKGKVTKMLFMGTRNLTMPLETTELICLQKHPSSKFPLGKVTRMQLCPSLD